LSSVLVFGIVATAYAGMRFKRVTSTVVDGTTTTALRTATAADLPVNDVNPELRVTWIATGVGGDQVIEYRLTADVSVLYACINKPGKRPQASNKVTLSGTVTTEGSVVSDFTGRVEGTLTTNGSLPDPGSFTCPTGQSLVTARVDYTNILLTDLTNNGSTTAPDASKVYFNV
jgi:hypothetical protein